MKIDDCKIHRVSHTCEFVTLPDKDGFEQETCDEPAKWAITEDMDKDFDYEQALSVVFCCPKHLADLLDSETQYRIRPVTP